MPVTEELLDAIEAARRKSLAESAHLQCESMNSIEVRPSRNPRWQTLDGWQVYEGEGVFPVLLRPECPLFSAARRIRANSNSRARFRVERRRSH
jgi:hypothetical protein